MGTRHGGRRGFTLVLNHPGSLRAMLAQPWRLQLSLAESFLYCDIDVEGDLEAVFGLADFLLKERRWGLRDKLWAARAVAALPRPDAARGGQGPARLPGRRDSPSRLAEAVHYHYDLDQDFYGLFLDDRRVYTCAYYESPQRTSASLKSASWTTSAGSCALYRANACSISAAAGVRSSSTPPNTSASRRSVSHSAPLKRRLPMSGSVPLG